MTVGTSETGGAVVEPRPPGRWETSTSATSGLGRNLAIRTDQGSDRCVLRLKGELCSSTLGLLDHHVDRLGSRWCHEVAVDLTQVTSMDAVGARVLVGLGHYVAGRGGCFEVRGAGRHAAALLREAEAEAARRLPSQPVK